MSSYEGYEQRLDGDDPERHYAERSRRREVRQPKGPVSVERIAARENLYCWYQERKRHGGQAAGLDGITYPAVSSTESGHILARLSKALIAGTYRPWETRAVPIPKAGGVGFRTLQLAGIFDRVAGKALQQAMEPLWERLFLSGSWAYRPKRGPWGMLARLEATLETEDRWVLVTEDVRGAFDNVRIKDVLAAHRLAFSDERLQKDLPDQPAERERLLDLIATVVQGADPKRQKGIDQGGPYSPIALNAHLHYAHDLPLTRAEPEARWWRYSDDLTYACLTAVEGEKLLGAVRRLIERAGLKLKGTGGVCDLGSGRAVQVLGFSLRRCNRQLQLAVSSNAMSYLGEKLDKCHLAVDPQSVARQCLYQWVHSAGPAFEDAERHVPKIMRLATDRGFREIASQEELMRRWEDGWIAWQRLRAAIRKPTDVGRGDDAFSSGGSISSDDAPF